jgi:hypothetical protein
MSSKVNGARTVRSFSRIFGDGVHIPHMIREMSPLLLPTLIASMFWDMFLLAMARSRASLLTLTVIVIVFSVTVASPGKK